MKKVIFLTSILFSFSAFAETAVYNISKMHCGGCKASIEAKVCKALEGKTTTCEAKLVDKKKQTGTLTITTKEGVAINDTEIMGWIAEAGEYPAVRAQK